MYTKIITILTVASLILISAFTTRKYPNLPSAKEKLSEYGFFSGKLSDLKPAKNVIPYELNTPLFSDYTHKLRFIVIPEGKTVSYNDKEVLDFPVGTTIIKNFYYYNDERNESKGKNILETRLLIRDEQGWSALPYFWNEQQTDAILEVAGSERDIAWKDSKGKKQAFHYVSPNVNQCKACHNRDEVMQPIGPSARQLNGDYAYEDGKMNQLLKWKKLGLLKGLPDNMNEVPKLANWLDQTASLNDRARAYLDINCAHCHRKEGPASTSGLYTLYNEKNPTVWGIYKTPVAAGKGSGGRMFDIVPGKPNESILMYRIESADPGEMMPEVGRAMVHKEGVQLIKDWIASMNPEDYKEYNK